MPIEFDRAKDEENRRLLRPPFAAAERVFKGPFIEKADTRTDYGEPRFIAVGPIAALDNRLFVVVYTWRGANRRIISFRKANDREARRYRDGYA